MSIEERKKSERPETKSILQLLQNRVLPLEPQYTVFVSAFVFVVVFVFIKTAFSCEHPSCPQLNPSYPGADHPSSLCIHFAHPLLPESTVCRSPQVFP